jgi:hypothetical protein
MDGLLWLNCFCSLCWVSSLVLLFAGERERERERERVPTLYKLHDCIQQQRQGRDEMNSNHVVQTLDIEEEGAGNSLLLLPQIFTSFCLHLRILLSKWSG